MACSSHRGASAWKSPIRLCQGARFCRSFFRRGRGGGMAPTGVGDIGERAAGAGARRRRSFRAQPSVSLAHPRRLTGLNKSLPRICSAGSDDGGGGRGGGAGRARGGGAAGRGGGRGRRGGGGGRARAGGGGARRAGGGGAGARRGGSAAGAAARGGGEPGGGGGGGRRRG